jgi:hypothetical protein
MTLIRKAKPLKHRGTEDAEGIGESEKQKPLPQIYADERGSGKVKKVGTTEDTEKTEEVGGRR